MKISNLSRLFFHLPCLIKTAEKWTQIAKIQYIRIMNKTNRLKSAILLDVFIILLILINVNLIIFDGLFAITLIQSIIQGYFPRFFEWYNTYIHANFKLIDLGFVAIFLLEFFYRWIVSIVEKSFDRWYFFPIFYWYDLLGCVPIASFRWLRLLRVFSLLIRLHKLGLINWKKTVFYRTFRRYSNIIVEEVSDRVIIKTLEGVKAEVSKGNPVTDQIIREVIRPQSTELVKWLSHRIQHITANVYASRKIEIKQYVDSRLNDAVKKNKEVKLISKIPLLGDQVSGMLEHAIRDIVFNVVDGLFTDLQENNQPLTEELTNITNELFTLIENDEELDGIIEKLINQSIDIVIKQVAIKEWMNEE